MTQTTSSAVELPQQAPVRPARRRGGSGVLSIVAVLVAAGLIFWGDRALRRHQKLEVAIIDREHALPVFVPMSDDLAAKLRVKSDWNELNDKYAAAAAGTDRKVFLSTSYALSDFISAHFSPDDDKRLQVLQNLVKRYPQQPESVPAYLALLDPQWKQTLRGQYPDYLKNLLQISGTMPEKGRDLLLELQARFKGNGEPDLQMQVLRHLRATQPIVAVTREAFEELLSRMDPADPDRPKLQADLDAQAKWREAMLEPSKWYLKFASVRANKGSSLADQERALAAAPPGPINPFTASALAYLVDPELKAGRFAEASRMRKELAGLGPVADLEAATQLAVENATPADLAPKKKNAPPTLRLPLDNHLIQVNRWRGLLAEGKQGEAAALADTLFGKEMKGLRKWADLEGAAERQDYSALSPLLTLERRTEGLPPELAGATEAYAGTIELSPGGKPPPPSIPARVDLWLTTDLFLAVFEVEEPRPQMPKPTVKDRDGDVTRDESVELFVNPDRWVDFYYQVAANSAGVVFDARVNNTAGGRRSQFRADPTINLDAKAKASPTPKGWSVRLVMPRKLLFPPGPTLVRFNARRFRYVDDPAGKKPIRQIYSWSTVGNADQHPENFGWLEVPH